MTPVRTSPFYPQSNVKIESWHKTLKRECTRPETPLNLEDARRIVAQYVRHYTNVGLHAGIGYVMPRDRLDGRDQVVWKEGCRKLVEARLARRAARRPQVSVINTPGQRSAAALALAQQHEAKRHFTLNHYQCTSSRGLGASGSPVLGWHPSRYPRAQHGAGSCRGPNPGDRRLMSVNPQHLTTSPGGRYTLYSCLRPHSTRDESGLATMSSTIW